MDYFLTEDQKAIKKIARRIAEEKVVPVRAELDETETFPWEIMRTCAETGLFGVSIPEAYGGLGGGTFENCIVVEELSRACLGVSVSYAASLLGSYPILVGGSEEQKKKYLPDVASGKRLAAFGLTEANAGSDAAGIRTEARRVGDDYILNGTKQWITNGGEAEVYSVIAMTDRSKGGRGATAFIVEKGMEGFSFGKKEKKLGIRASATRELVFQDCKVPKENVIGREGMGFILAMRTFDRTRPGIGAQGLGVAQGALEAATAYAKEREQFDRKIISFQAVQHMLADMATQVEASRALVYAVARYIDSNPRDFSKVSAMSKVFPSDTAMKVTVDALQIFGGYGYMRDYPIEKMMRDAKILQIYEGTNQIQRNVIALELIKEAASKKEMNMKKIGVVFPGQGSQYVGMGKELYDRFEYVREMFESADKAVDFGLSKLCFNGPEEELRKTYNTQPAILLASYAAWVVLNKEMNVTPFLLAGHSLGEYTALLASGLFSLNDALRLTRKRGILMEDACPAGVGGMVALVGPVYERVDEVCRSVSHGDYVASPANLNSPDQLVLSGDVNALKEVVERSKGEGYRKAVFLNVSGPFHSPLMRPAAEKLKNELEGAVLSPMKVPVVSNVDASANDDSEEVRDLLFRQMFSPVRWEGCVRTMEAMGVEVFLEVGPQKVLTNLMKKIVPHLPCYHVETMEEIEALRSVLA